MFHRGMFSLLQRKSNRLKSAAMHGGVVLLFLVFLLSLFNFYHSAYALPDLLYSAAKTNDNPTVYLLSGSGYKLPVPSMDVLRSYGVNAQDITVAPKQFLDLYSTPKYVAQGGTSSVYLLDNGQRRFLNNQVKATIAPKGIF